MGEGGGASGAQVLGHTEGPQATKAPHLIDKGCCVGRQALA